MEIKLSPRQKKKLERVAREAGTSPAAMARELLDKALSARGRRKVTRIRRGDEEALVRRQRKAMEKLLKALDAFPVVDRQEDGLSGSRDHDKILYGGKW